MQRAQSCSSAPTALSALLVSPCGGAAINPFPFARMMRELRCLLAGRELLAAAARASALASWRRRAVLAIRITHTPLVPP